MQRRGRWSAFGLLNGAFLVLLAAVCVLPIMHIVSLSLSSSVAVNSGSVGIIPVDITARAYGYAFSRPRFVGSIMVSFRRVLLGTGINLLCSILAAYPLSKRSRQFPGRTVFAWFFALTLFVSGGLVPRFMVVAATGLIDSIWALVLPSAVPAFCIVILLNYFRTIPAEFEESAFMDGAGHWRTLLAIYAPLAVPAFATIVVYQAVAHWNEWLEGAIYMNRISNYPLSTYLRNLIVQPNFDTMTFGDLSQFKNLADRSFRAAQVIVATLPIIVVYPFVQRYFVKGLSLGGVKG